MVSLNSLVMSRLEKIVKLATLPKYFLNTNMLSTRCMQEPIIRKIFCNNAYKTLVSIPNELALNHGIKLGNHVVLEDRPDGMFFKKLEVK